MRMIILAAVAFWFSVAQGEQLHTVTVSGVGQVAVAPDLAYFNFQVSHQAMDAATAQQSVEDQTRKLIAVVRDLDIDTDSLVAEALRLSPQYSYARDRNRRVFDGYSVTRQIQFTLTDLDQLGDAYQRLIEAGATSLNPARLDSSQRQQLQERALAIAYDDAHRKALVLATASALTLGSASKITVGQDLAAPILSPRLAVTEMASDVPPVYETGQLTIVEAVNVTFLLKQ